MEKAHTAEIKRELSHIKAELPRQLHQIVSSSTDDMRRSIETLIRSQVELVEIMEEMLESVED